MENTITTSNFENKLKERFSADRNRIVNFIKENFNVEEIIKIDEDDT